MLKINGVEVPTPSEVSIGIMDISEATRNARGTMIAEIITTKRKLNLGFRHLKRDELSRLLKLINPMFFTVEYIDPETNDQQSGTFYVGDRNVGVLDYRNGDVRYKEIKFNFIER